MTPDKANAYHTVHLLMKQKLQKAKVFDQFPNKTKSLQLKAEAEALRTVLGDYVEREGA